MERPWTVYVASSLSKRRYLLILLQVEDTNVKIEQYRMDPDDASPAPLEPEPQRSSTAKEPRLSWFLITLLLVGVTVVSSPTILVIYCRLLKWPGGRVCSRLNR